MLYKVIAVFLEHGERDSHHNWHLQCGGRTVGSFKWEDLTCSDLCCIKISLADMKSSLWHGVDTGEQSRHVEVVQASNDGGGHKEVVEGVKGWDQSWDIFWSGADRTH